MPIYTTYYRTVSITQSDMTHVDLWMYVNVWQIYHLYCTRDLFTFDSNLSNYLSQCAQSGIPNHRTHLRPVNQMSSGCARAVLVAVAR